MFVTDSILADNHALAEILLRVTKRVHHMATAKKVAPKAAAKTMKVTAPAKAAKPLAKAPGKKAPVSKTAKAVANLTAKIATLTERKNKIAADISALKDQRTAMKTTPVAVATPVKAKPASKAAAPAKKAKAAAPAKKAKAAAKK